MNDLSIEFDEGETHQVIFNVPEAIDLTVYAACMQVRRDYGNPLVMEFSTTANPPTMEKVGQSLKITFKPELSRRKAGDYKWQLMLSASADDIIKFPVKKLKINRAINDRAIY